MELATRTQDLRSLQNLQVTDTNHNTSDNAIRCQLVQILFHHLMRKKGIPLEWIDCKTQCFPVRDGDGGMHVRLVINQWHDRLMTYAFALQTELITDIEQFEPGASNWLEGIYWQLNVEKSCPHATVPDNSFWQGTTLTPL